jgi:hypothetical protein
LRDRNRILGVQPHGDTPSGRLRWYPLDRRDGSRLSESPPGMGSP